MRHLGRTHSISITWLHDEMSKNTFRILYISMILQAADIFTKFFPRAKKTIWGNVRRFINVLDEEELTTLRGLPG